MHIGQMIESKYLKQDDIGAGKLVTITQLKRVNVAMENQQPEMKYVMHFIELGKPMVMNPTNIQLCAQALATEETDEWMGRKIVLYVDPTVSMGGKLVGGIRIRRPNPRTAQPAPRPAAPPPEELGGVDGMDDDIPF